MPAAAITLAALAGEPPRPMLAGFLRCEIQAEAPGYLHQETHEWFVVETAIAGSTELPARWFVRGEGWLRRGDDTLSTRADWLITAPQALDSTLIVQLQGNDNLRIYLQPPPPIARGALTGSSQISDRNVPRPATRIVRDVHGWVFDPIQGRRASDGSFAGVVTREVAAAVGPQQPNDAKVTVTVAWSFAPRGRQPALLPPPTLVSRPAPSAPAGGSAPTAAVAGPPAGGISASTAALEARIAELERRLAELERANANRPPPPTPGTAGEPAGGAQAGGPISPARPPRTPDFAGIALPVATLESVTPASAAPGTSNVRVTIAGRDTRFAPGASTANFGPGITVAALAVSSPTSATATLTIDRTAAAGPRSVTLTTGGEVASLAGGFSVVLPPPPPSGSPAGPAIAAPQTGRYRIVLTGFRANRRTFEGIEGDGPGDEIYASARVQVAKRDLSSWTTSFVRTAVHGNIQSGSDRIRGGSADRQGWFGGFVDGDVFPMSQDPARTTMEPVANSFPLLLWEGSLTDGGDIVTIKPVLWESDGNDCVWQGWSNDRALVREGPGADDRKNTLLRAITDSPLTPIFGLGPVITVYNYYEAESNLPGICICRPGRDRPIGVPQDGGLASWGNYHDATIVVTREAVERALNAGPTPGGLLPGVIALRWVESGQHFAGDYEAFIRIERVGGSSLSAPGSVAGGGAPPPGTPATADATPTAPSQRTVPPALPPGTPATSGGTITSMPGRTNTPAIPPGSGSATTPDSSGTPITRMPDRTGFPALPSGGTTPAPGGPAAGGAATPAPASGTYLVTATAVWCSKMTRDDPFDRDGKGDEIYAAAFVRRYDRNTFQLLESTHLQTLVYGDTNGRSDRVPGGTQTRTGGVAPGNVLPTGGTAARTQPAQQSVLPLKLWQGTLRDGANALVISPTVWESDDEPTFLSTWVQGQQQASNWLFTLQKVQTQLTSRAFGPLLLEPTERISYGAENKVANVTGGIIAAGLGIPWNFDQFFVQKRDRPIGVAQNDLTSLAVQNTVVILTREIIEAALSVQPPPVDTPAPFVLISRTKPGVMIISFQDTSTEVFRRVAPYYDAAHYVMTLQVERL